MIDLTRAKLFLRVDHADEDALITALIEAAEATVQNYLNLDELPEAEPVTAAVLMLVGALFETRESVTDKPLSESVLFTRLLSPYRSMAV